MTKDLAYKIATNNYLTKSLNFQQFNETKCSHYVLEDYETLTNSDLDEAIIELANSILAKTAQPIRANNCLADLHSHIDRLPSEGTTLVNITDLRLAKECYEDDVMSQREYLEADVVETLTQHYDFTPKQVKQFLHINLDSLLEESYKAQTEHLLNAVNKFKG